MILFEIIRSYIMVAGQGRDKGMHERVSSPFNAIKSSSAEGCVSPWRRSPRRIARVRSDSHMFKPEKSLFETGVRPRTAFGLFFRVHATRKITVVYIADS